MDKQEACELKNSLFKSCIIDEFALDDSDMLNQLIDVSLSNIEQTNNTVCIPRRVWNRNRRVDTWFNR